MERPITNIGNAKVAYIAACVLLYSVGFPTNGVYQRTLPIIKHNPTRYMMYLGPEL